tara:strand:- start:169 stop:447 length:279 start_codon:yes stop_codon:yes gene_type:complete
MIKPIFEILREQNRLLFVHIICIVVFAFIYYKIVQQYGTRKDKENFDTVENSLYYSTITHFTVGFGDISPESKTMRRLTMFQVLMAFFLMNR